MRCSSVPSAYCVVALFSLRFPPPLSKLSPSVAAAGGVIGVLAGSVWLCVCRIGGWLGNAVAVCPVTRTRFRICVCVQKEGGERAGVMKVLRFTLRKGKQASRRGRERWKPSNRL